MYGEVADELHQPRISGAFHDGHAEERHAGTRDALPVDVTAADLGVEEQQPHEVTVAARYLAEVGEQRGREGDPGEYVEALTDGFAGDWHDLMRFGQSAREAYAQGAEAQYVPFMPPGEQGEWVENGKRHAFRLLRQA